LGEKIESGIRVKKDENKDQHGDVNDQRTQFPDTLQPEDTKTKRNKKQL
jgi:hypothetical protein